MPGDGVEGAGRDIQKVAVEDASGERVREIYRQLAGAGLPDGDWAERLYDALSRNEVVYQLAELLAPP